MQHGQARKRIAALICGFLGRNVNSAVGISIQSSSYINTMKIYILIFIKLSNNVGTLKLGNKEKRFSFSFL